MLQIPKGVNIPCFLEEVCTPLLRAGQQLQVLSKLLDAPSTSRIIDSPFKSLGSFQDTLLSFTWSDTLVNKSIPDGPVVVSSKTDTQGDAQQPKGFSQMLKGFSEVSLAGLAKSPLFQQETEPSGIMGRTVSTIFLWNNLHIFLFIMFQSLNRNCRVWKDHARSWYYAWLLIS